MYSEIQNITPYYSKLENILPEELPVTKITVELGRARNEINKIIEEDMKKIKDLSTRQKKSIAFSEFTKPASIIKRAFYIDGDPSYDDVSFY
jgi:GTP1/Obg family GTP-binding protein